MLAESARPSIDRPLGVSRWWSPPSRERLFVFIAVILIVLFRSALFVFQTTLDFDSDQAVVGLMAKHLMQGRAFPLFFYGQNYLLGVEAWLAAPVFLLLGVSVTALKLPLLAINIAVGLLLVMLLEREVGLRPLHALVASLFFLLAPPGTVSYMLATNGGNVEPFLYVLLLWLTRRRRVWFGLIFGVGFLQREFTIYGVLAILVMGIADRGWRRPEDWRPLLGAFRVAAEVWLVVEVLRPLASAAGPGTTIGAISNLPSNNLIQLSSRVCVDARTVAGGLVGLATIHWARLFGTAPLPANFFGLESQTTQGLSGSGLVLGAAVVVMLWRITLNARVEPDWRNRYRFPIYLTLVGGLSAAVFVVGRCGADSALRYDLLSLLGAVGVTAWFLAIERSGWFRRIEIAVILAWAALSAAEHGRIWAEYARHPPVAAKTMIIRNLDARGIKYATSDYWIAYYVTFITNERIIMTPDTFMRIANYEQQVLSHRTEAIRVSRTPCHNGKRVFEGVYFCAVE